MKEELIRKIIQIEWEMFQNVTNAGGTASCQQDPKTFEIMRLSQAMSWTEPMLKSYLEDLIEAQQKRRNLMTEKYARMMKYTFPDEYSQIADRLPPLDTETLFLIDRITAFMIRWGEEIKIKYPNVMGSGRPLYSTEDTPYATSLETYWRGELSTYGVQTLRLCNDYFIKCVAESQNNYEIVLENTVKQYGYTSIQQAEKDGRMQRM